MQRVNFDDELEKLLERDPRFTRDAYHFMREALDHTQKTMGKPHKDEVRHVTGQQLLGGIKDYALAQYGPMTMTVLEEWGIHRCEDFGEIVFNMVEANLLAKTEKDTRDDFKGGYEFAAAFRHPFLPISRRMARQPRKDVV
jgi:uncharacterized repeat protein (TIGR04138 family)